MPPLPPQGIEPPASNVPQSATEAAPDRYGFIAPASQAVSAETGAPPLRLPETD